MTDTDTRSVAAGRLFSRPAAVASCVGFVLIGMLQALYGPVVPGLREEFGLSPSGAGLGLSLHFTGGVVGVLAFNAIHSRISNRALLAASYGLMAAGAAGFALAPDWPLALCTAFLGGLGFGGIDYGLNQLFAVGFGDRSTAMLNVLNAHFGIGAVLGPAIVAWLGPDEYAYAFGACAVLAALLIVFGSSGVRTGVVDEGPAVVERPLGLPRVLVGFLALYILNVGVEAGVGGWEPTHLETVGYSAAVAASATSVYWLMMTAGRFLVVPITLRYSPERILTICAAGMTVCLLLARVKEVAPVAYAGVGLFIAPVFPTGLPWLNRALPQAKRAGAWVIAASMIGGVAAPPLLGAGIETSGIHAVPWLLTALSAASLAATVWLIRLTRR
ncbi:MFS transporter [Streptomyces sp. NBC_00201]|uniref:MFS transporter n=2 Tax=unclassified Streptomyces TaxID=2593676 RepID=UPI0022503B35|nr:MULTISPECIES: MFS transporter [unclassified Streptomyces]MCX5051927.1 MFS transporter [Streptomyces sp. NBC_00474]MCX5062258.1 MFS transporter [Streptomyces sp. NBC_00452]MCX5249822.1 MFS transporter [Streptomyces sp. NBC_00201]MCX5292133.1 MFS transporter [Streptomyces sp. NBC_00183]